MELAMNVRTKGSTSRSTPSNNDKKSNIRRKYTASRSKNAMIRSLHHRSGKRIGFDTRRMIASRSIEVSNVRELNDAGVSYERTTWLARKYVLCSTIGFCFAYAVSNLVRSDLLSKKIVEEKFESLHDCINGIYVVSPAKLIDAVDKIRNLKLRLLYVNEERLSWNQDVNGFNSHKKKSLEEILGQNKGKLVFLIGHRTYPVEHAVAFDVCNGILLNPGGSHADEGIVCLKQGVGSSLSRWLVKETLWPNDKKYYYHAIYELKILS